MELHIDNETSVEGLQEQFSALYPFLKLQFLTWPPAAGRAGQKAGKVRLELPAKKLRPMAVPVYLPVGNNITVAQLLASFIQIGLFVQVCRKAATQWVETSLTDDWTLARQNNEAKLTSIPHP